MEDRIIDAEEKTEDIFERNIRPQSLEEYVGQQEIKENLRVFIKAAIMRSEPLDHVLLYGPPGLGKTTLAHIIANELGSNIKTASGPSIEKTGDLAAVLSTLEPGDVLFIDEIHRMPKFIEEVLYPAMEDFEIDLVIGETGKSRNIKIDLPPFTLVGATTRAGDISSPLRDRFGIISKLEYYKKEELKSIIKRTSRVLDMPIDDEAAEELSGRCRKTPRIANRLFKRVRDFALVEGDTSITKNLAKNSLNRLKVDEYGLDAIDIEYLTSLITKFNGGPVGVETIATSIGEEVSTIEDVVEPFLLQEGFIKRTQRGRVATEKAYDHLKIDHNTSMFWKKALNREDVNYAKTEVIINGTGTCGKDTFVDFASRYANVTNFSSIDKVKEIASFKFFLNIKGMENLANYGWPGTKTEKDRKFLSEFKQAWAEYNDGPYSETVKAIEDFRKSDNDILFIHIREPEEIKKVQNTFDSITLLIKREGLANIESNESDKNVDDYNYDYTIINSNLENLDREARKFVSEIMVDSKEYKRKLIKKEDE